MRLTEEQKQELEAIYQRFLNDPKIQKMKDIPMHRGSNTYLHSFRVAKLSIKRAMSHKEVDLKTLLIASILHDYYLYDWRKDKEKRKHHGSNHPSIAVENASKDFGISEEEKEIIKSHMWPINIKDFPKTKEARIMSHADKNIATREALTCKKHKKKRMDIYYKGIERLFD